MKNIFVGIILLWSISSCAQNKSLSSSLPSVANQQKRVRTVSGREIPVEQLDAFIHQAMDSVDMPGLSIAIINNEEVVYQRAFGVTNVESGTPVTEKTLFEAASLSKPLFAYFALKMVEKGVLDLDKPMYQYLPHPGIDSASLEFYRMVTPRMILAHSAGFPNWSNGEPITILFKPGTGFSYSGEAYQYLAGALGTLLDVGWESRLDSVFQQEVARPLQLKNSYFTHHENTALYKATGHQEGKPTDREQFGKAFGAGYSLHTEAADFARFLIEMMKGRHLNQDLLAEMLKEQSRFPAGHELLKTGQTGWGLGFARRPTENGIRYMHTGNNDDFQAYCCFYKEQGYGLVVFTNSDKIEPFYAQLGKFLDDEF